MAASVYRRGGDLEQQWGNIGRSTWELMVDDDRGGGGGSWVEIADTRKKQRKNSS